MTAISDVKAVWVDRVFNHADIVEITENAINFEFTDDSQFEIERLYKINSDGLGEPNFFEYIIEKGERIVEVGGAAAPEYQFTVSVRYTRGQDTAGENEIAVRSAIETLCNVVRTELGTTWDTLNARTALEILPQPVTRETVNQTPCIRQVVQFTAFI